MGQVVRFISTTIAAVIACIVLLICATTIHAGVLKGQITDKIDATPLAGATIEVRAVDGSMKPIVMAADHDGRFEVKNIPSGKYDVIISSLGFVTERYNDVQISESGIETINAGMAPSLINLDAVSVTASRRPEKIVESPASVSVLESEDVGARTTLTPTEHVKGLPAVDVASTGLNQSNMVVRGFNNIFSGALMVMTDHRIARVPSLRFNAYNFIPTINDDIERIEIVSGPGSALYGPNSAAGVMHIITKSPFASRGTTVSIGGGERDLVIGSIRHAGIVGSSVGYKISGEYYQGHDWETHDPFEPDTIQKFRPTADGPVPVGDSIPNRRNFDIEKLAAEGRVDFLFGDDMSFILNGGFSRAKSIELTGLGAAQADNWTYGFGQMRFRYKNLFAQGYVNMSDAGDTYLLNTGQLIVDRSKLWVAQIQHQYAPDKRLEFTYGIDALLTRPETDGTINGNNESDDNINEIGGYLQANLMLTDQLDLVGAARLDDHNKLEDMVFSPRAALVYHPVKEHNFRLTYNRAFSTPDNNNLYLDLLQSDDPLKLGAAFEPFLPFRPEIDIRVEGVPESGFHWNYSNDMPTFHSPFAPLDPRGLTELNDITMNDPIFTNVMWNLGRAAVMSEVESILSRMVPDTVLANDMYNAIDALTPSTVSGVNNRLMTLNPDDQAYEPSDLKDIADIERLKPTITKTIELGYHGILSDRFQFKVDVYRTEKNNFIGPLTVETPNVFLDPATLWDYLYQQISDTLAAHPEYDSLLIPIDILLGNRNGDPADELADSITSGATRIPFGTVTPNEALDPNAILVTYRNFGDISFYGSDFSFAVHLSKNWNLGGSYSYISKNFFEKDDDQVHDIHLNSPRHKAGLFVQYMNPKWGLNVNSRYRYVDAFDMNSPFYGTSIKAYHLVDLNAGIGFFYNTYLTLTVQNLLDNKHVEFIGGPEIGRLAVMRLSRSF